MTTTHDEQALRQRNLLYLTTPSLWPDWPFLPLVRRQGGKEDLGLLYDALGKSSKAGHAATVFLANLFLLPATEEEFLRLPREVHDSAEAIYAAGWRVD